MIRTLLWSKHIGPVSSGFASAGLRVLCTLALVVAGLAISFHAVPVHAQTPPGPEPVATITATPTCGDAPLNVCFSATATGLDPAALPWSYTWDFGDGTFPTPNANDPLPCHAFMTPNTQYTVTVTIQDTKLTVAKGSILISTNPLTVSACADVTNGGAPLLVQFNDGCGIISGGVPPYSVEWDFGDGSAKCYDWSTEHAFSQPGTYYTSVKVTDSCSPPNVVTDTHLVITVTQLSVSVNATSDRLCGPEGTLVCFSGQARGGVGPYAYTWDFGDGSPTVTEQSPCHTYDSPGVYTVSLTATDSLSNTDTDSHLQIVVTQPLSVTTSVSRTSGYAPFTAYFTSSITGGTGPYTYLWDFGDGATSTLGSPSHVYDAPGYYTVKLTVTDSCVPSASASDDHIKLGIYPIQVTADVNQPCGYAPLNEIFTGSATGGMPPYNYSWDFGDGTTGSTLQNPSHSYLAVGTYTATLTVTDSAGQVGTGTVVASVTPELNVSAVASATMGPAPLTADLSSAVTGGTPPYTYDWDFNDGSQHSTSPADQHTWVNVGAYVPTLTVTDSCGHSSTSSVNIDAWGDIVPTASADVTCGYSPLNVQFTGAATGGVPPYTYSWNFGDGSPVANLQNPAHGYEGVGDYQVTLTVTDSQANSSVDTQVIISVTDPLSVSIQASQTVGPPPLKVNLGSTVSGGTPPYTYTWDYGDGSNPGVEATSQHIYGDVGVYTVTLAVSDSCGHITNQTVTINAYDALKATVTAATACGTAPMKACFSSEVTGGVPPYTYSWNFDDSSPSSSDASPCHDFASAGTYNVTVTATDSLGNHVTSEAAPVQVVDPFNLVVAAHASQVRGMIPMDVVFSSSVTGGAAPYTYDWDFGDGSAHEVGSAPEHVYSQVGTYTVTLVVSSTDACGKVYTASDSHLTITTQDGPSITVMTPTANAHFGASVLFTSSIFDDVSIESVDYYVSGVLVGSASTPPYAFTWDSAGLNGNYSVSAIVRDSLGRTATSDSVPFSVGNPILIGRVVRHGGPFRLKVFGNYFQPGCVIKINGMPVPGSVYKGPTAVVAKKGGALKAMVPKGIPVVITVTNPDGGVSNGVTYTR